MQEKLENLLFPLLFLSSNFHKNLIIDMTKNKRGFIQRLLKLFNGSSFWLFFLFFYFILKISGPHQGGSRFGDTAHYSHFVWSGHRTRHGSPWAGFDDSRPARKFRRPRRYEQRWWWQHETVRFFLFYFREITAWKAQFYEISIPNHLLI